MSGTTVPAGAPSVLDGQREALKSSNESPSTGATVYDLFHFVLDPRNPKLSEFTLMCAVVTMATVFYTDNSTGRGEG